MTTAEKNLMVIQGGGLDAFPPAKVEVIRNTVAKGATNDELEMYLHLAARYDLDPFAKEIWFVKRGSDATIMTSRDGYLKIAQKNPDFIGLTSFVVREGDEFSVDASHYDVSHKFGSKRGKILGAWAKCERDGRKPVICFVELEDYYDDKSPVWKKYTSAMIQKVAEVFVLKRQFGISGLVTSEEMPESFTQPIHQPAQSTPQQQPDRASWLAAINELNVYAESVGLTGEELRAKGNAVLGKANPKQWSLDDIVKVRKKIEAYETSPTNAPSTVGTEQEPFNIPADEDLPF